MNFLEVFGFVQTPSFSVITNEIDDVIPAVTP